ncbi:MAG: protease inhibitor I42 family protein [Phycisphaeraceae bacterium]|nr:protease inhibitor I42 family protein [Phycisphaeraceae bacterium]
MITPLSPRRIVLAALAAATLTAFACVSDRDRFANKQGDVVLTGGKASQEEASATIDPSTTIIVRLASQSGTGYSWRLVTGTNEWSVLSFRGKATEREPGTANLPGGPFQEVFSFRANRTGEATLEFVNERPWETGVAPANRYILHVKVQNR